MMFMRMEEESIYAAFVLHESPQFWTFSNSEESFVSESLFVFVSIIGGFNSFSSLSSVSYKAQQVNTITHNTLARHQILQT